MKAANGVKDIRQPEKMLNTCGKFSRFQLQLVLWLVRAPQQTSTISLSYISEKIRFISVANKVNLGEKRFPVTS